MTWMIYLAGFIENIDTFLNFSLILLIIILFFVSYWMLEDDIFSDIEENLEIIKKYKLGIKILVFNLLLVIFIPSSKTVYMMMGSHYLNQKDIPQKVLKVLNNKLDEMIEEKK